MKTILLTLIILSLNLFASNVATITALKGKADIQRDGALVVAALGSKLEQKDNILTKDNSKLQIIFKDETVISIGKNSEFSISEYLFEDNAPPVAKFNMIRGAMRTITGQIGNIAPQRFSVATKTATIGIRGTNFSVFVENDGSSSAFCTFGAISVAIAGTTHVVQQGFYIALSPSGEVEIKEFTPEVLKEKKEKHFNKKKEEEKEQVAQRDSGGADGEEEEGTGSGNTAQLDVTTDDNSGMIITDVSDTVGDTTQQNTVTSNLTPNSVIAAFTQSSAYYEGTFTRTSGVGFAASGTAGLNINFDQDTATLYFDAGQMNASYNNFSGLNTNTFSGSQNGNIGTVSGNFFGADGKNAQGTYSYGESGTITSNGTYNVTDSGGTAPY